MKQQNVKITYNGGSPHKSLSVVDAESGEPIPNVYRVEIDIDMTHIPRAILHAYVPAVELEIDAEIQGHCPYCGRQVEERQKPTDTGSE